MRRLAPSFLIPVLALLAAGCGEDAAPTGPEPPPIRLLTEADVTAWSAISLALVQARGEDSLAGRFGTFEELALYLKENPGSIEADCAGYDLTAADYVAICHAIHVCRSIEFGLWLEESARTREASPPPLPPVHHDDLRGAPVPPDLTVAPGPPPVAAEAIEASLPETARKNLEMYRQYAVEIERQLHLFHFHLEGGVR